MNPTAQPTVSNTAVNQQGQIQPFTDAHNAAYNNLRNLMMNYNAAGVPGIDKILNTLNKTHTEVSQNYAPNNTGASVSPQAAPQQNSLQGLNQIMQGIRQGATSQLPNGYQGYGMM